MTQNDLPLRRIISGGQTGADRGALDAAIEAGLEHGGWCPLGRRAEDGRIPERYQLVETTDRDYRTRTLANIEHADATLIVTSGPLSGGTGLTFQRAHEIYLARDGLDCLISPRVLVLKHPDPAAVRDWLRRLEVAVLNVAGPRESKRPGIQVYTKRLLLRVLGVNKMAR